MSLMMKEIAEQPEALRRTFEAERGHVREFRRLAGRRFRMIVLVARGTSDNAALFGRYLLELTAGIPVVLAAPSIYTLYHTHFDLKRTLMIGISQSGESTDVNRVLHAGHRQGAYTVGITNEARSTMARTVDDVFTVRAGKERSVAATKTYTGQLLALYLIANGLGSAIRLDDVARIPAWAQQALTLENPVRELAAHYRPMRHAMVVARGLNYASAFEFSLKLMETCYVAAERFSSADFLHGPIAMVEGGLPIFLFLPPGPCQPGLAALARKLRGMHAETVLFTSKEVRLPISTFVVRIPAVIPELYTAIPYIIPGQIFAALLAEAKGINPDRPRFLHKVTRTI
ncbi:MAG TPA: SIS domain-containing protein [Candidatus Dormibacteraeota bacterium]|nr:SIS domain-containing protein [Candidatus Dormibacteraeota bacterium]